MIDATLRSLQLTATRLTLDLEKPSLVTTGSMSGGEALTAVRRGGLHEEGRMAEARKIYRSEGSSWRLVLHRSFSNSLHEASSHYSMSLLRQ
jgi:hypothetical protein